MKIRWILLIIFVVYVAAMLYRDWDIEYGPRDDGGYDLARLLAREKSVNIRELYGDDVTEIQFNGPNPISGISPEICNYDNRYYQSVAIIRGDKCDVYEFKSSLQVGIEYTSWSAPVGPNTMVVVCDLENTLQEIFISENKGFAIKDGKEIKCNG